MRRNYLQTNRKPDRGRHEEKEVRVVIWVIELISQLLRQTNYKHKPVHGEIIGLYLAGSVIGYKD